MTKINDKINCESLKKLLKISQKKQKIYFL